MVVLVEHLFGRLLVESSHSRWPFRAVQSFPVLLQPLRPRFLFSVASAVSAAAQSFPAPACTTEVGGCAMRQLAPAYHGGQDPHGPPHRPLSWCHSMQWRFHSRGGVPPRPNPSVCHPVAACIPKEHEALSAPIRCRSLCLAN